MEQSINTRIFESAKNLFNDLADEIAAHIEGLLVQKKDISLVLSGGGTPRSLYRALVGLYENLPWSRIHFYFGDERYVPHDHIHSNYRMAREIFFDPLNIPQKNIFPMPTHFEDPECAALNYEMLLKSRFETSQPQFDLLLLGIGDDGHTASLFPSAKTLAEKERWVVVGQAPNEPRTRLTLTLPVINHAHRIIFMAIGTDKAEAVRKAIKGPGEHLCCPAGLVRPVNGKLEWWLDHAAAGKLESTDKVD
jgi:6-phosphogluconolactonase